MKIYTFTLGQYRLACFRLIIIWITKYLLGAPPLQPIKLKARGKRMEKALPYGTLIAAKLEEYNTVTLATLLAIIIIASKKMSAS